MTFKQYMYYNLKISTSIQSQYANYLFMATLCSCLPWFIKCTTTVHLILMNNDLYNDAVLDELFYLIKQLLLIYY